MPELKQSHGLRQSACGPECGFLIRSPDETEVVRVVRAHVKDAHAMELTETQARAAVTAVR
ncbi:MAG: DUF1059 domain-containing protein [Euryarchaeota archaeon]|nr:DUF1059 domain-containing protein [Euryarchaeota archaeon]